MVEMLSEIDGIVCPTPKGAFYCYPSVEGLIDREIRGKRPANSAELAALILEEVEVPGANLLGAMLGVALEYLTLLIGYQALLLVAALLYAGSFALLPRAARAPSLVSN